MNAAEVLDMLTSRGFAVEVIGDRLRIGPQENISDDLRASVKTSKVQLIQALKRNHWVMLALSHGDPDYATAEEDEWFLSAARVLRKASDHGNRLARWNGLKEYLSQHLPDDAMEALRAIASARMEGQ